jgi:PAS domain S-box-containing protein
LAHENAVIAEIGRIISSTLDIGEVYEGFAEEVRKIISFDRIVIDIILHEKNQFTIAYITGIEIPGRRVGDSFPLTRSDNEYLMKSRSGLLLQAEEEEEVVANYPILLPTYRAGFQSLMSVPLISKDQVIGGLHFRSLKPFAYTDLDLRLAERVGTQIAGAIANAQLFIEHKQTEEALSLERLRFRTLSEAAPFGMMLIDPEGRFIYVNPKFRELFGYDLDDTSDGRTWFRKIYPEPDYRHEVIAAWIQDLSRSHPGERRPRTFTVTCKDGTQKIIIFISVRLATGENLVTCEDITQHKRAEEALRSSEEEAKRMAQENAIMAEIGRIITSTLTIEDVYERFAEEVRKLIHFDRLAINIVDAKNETITIAYAAGLNIDDRLQGNVFSLKGSANEDLIRTRSAILIQTEDEQEVARSFPTLLSTFQAGFRSLLSVPLISKDQVIGALHFRALKPRAYTETDIRLAERVGTQVAGAIYNAQLFTERLSLQEQLRHSQKMEAIGRLAGGIAHDFNNLLTVISGYSQLSLSLLRQDEPLAENLAEIQRATERATALTRHLLAFSRRQILDMRLTDLNHIVQDLDKMLRRVIGEDIELTTVLARDLWKVKLDPSQIEQVILNLAVNARDAMPKGGRLTIETANAQLGPEIVRSHVGVKPGSYVKLSIRDTGIGMSQEVIERVFEPFFTTKEKGKGTGLGLSTVYGIVIQSGGTIWVRSEPGQGATFEIHFPRTTETEETFIPRSVPVRRLLGSETILLVEDEEAVRVLARKTLQSFGYRVLEAINGEEALRVVAKGRDKIHLLLTDVVMPGMSGREVAERLSPLFPGLKILYMTGYADTAIVHHGILEPGTALLLKPFKPDGLAQKVREVLDKPVRNLDPTVRSQLPFPSPPDG